MLLCLITVKTFYTKKEKKRGKENREGGNSKRKSRGGVVKEGHTKGVKCAPSLFPFTVVFDLNLFTSLADFFF